MQFIVSIIAVLLCSSGYGLSLGHEEFTVAHEWNFINFTWPSQEENSDPVFHTSYIPENVAMAGIKIYKDKIYIALPRIRPGTPVTLGFISIEHSPKLNPPISPFPNWKMNVKDDDSGCSTLQNVQSMEIDRKGIMWVIDGFRINDMTKCPTKILLLDLNNHGNVVHNFTFPDSISLSEGGFLNDIVVDDDFAYISDASSIDPGLVVYSSSKNKAWKLRDRTMFAEIPHSTILVDDLKSTMLVPIDGIALSPKLQENPERNVYFCALAGTSLYSISTKILKAEEASKMGNWRRDVQFIGNKDSQSDGLVIDNAGDLYYGLLPLYAVGKWNVSKSFESKEIVDQNRDTMIWTDSFAFDDKGYLHLLANQIHKFFDPDYKLVITEQTKFKILKVYTGTNSYIYS